MRSLLLVWMVMVGVQKRGGFVQTLTASLGTETSLTECPRRTYDVSNIENLVCGEKSLCAKRHSKSICQCDNECAFYGDCCVDAPALNPPEQMTDQKCQRNGDRRIGYYMTSTCPEHFADQSIISLCERTDRDDVLLSIPVTDLNDTTLFKNLYCAVCHDRKLETLYFWKLSVKCKAPTSSPTVEAQRGAGVDDGTSSSSDGGGLDDGTSVSSVGGGIDDGTSASSEGGGIDDGTSVSTDDVDIDDGISVSPDEADIGTSVLTDKTGEEYGTEEPLNLKILRERMADPSCFKYFEYRPENENSVPFRECSSIDINHFPSLSEGRDIACPPYVSPYLSGEIVYRNRECAACNNATVSMSPCEVISSGGYDGQGVHSFSNLFLFADGYKLTYDSEVQKTSCGQDEIFDPFSKFCRSVIARYEPRSISKQGDVFTVTGEIYVQHNDTACVTYNDEICVRVKELIASSFVSLVSSVVADFQGRLDISVIKCNKDKNISFCDADVLPSNLCKFEGILYTDEPDQILNFSDTIHSLSLMLNESYRRQECESQQQLPISIKEIWLTFDNSSCKSPNVNPHASNIGFLWLEEQAYTKVLSVEGSCLNLERCESDIVKFQTSEFSFNGTHVFLEDRHQHFGQGTYYQLRDGSVGICVDLLETPNDVLTIVLTTLSIIGLTATALTYLILPRLRNNMGKSILSLVIALLVAQVFQLALWDLTSNVWVCTFVAMVSHYTFLATFFWTNILGFDLSRTFGNRAKMQTVRDSKKTFLYFSLYAWGCPLVIVAVCSVFHFSEVEKVTFWYGNRFICWLGDTTGLLLAFGVPVALILLVNVVFFIDTVIGILRARNETRRATSSNPLTLNRDRKKDFLLFCKLSCIMGLTWLFGFMYGAYPHIKALEVVFVVLNSSQGVFIFIAFGCSPRVIEMWRTGYSKRKLASTRSHSLAATAKSSVSSMTSHQIRQPGLRVARVA